MQPRKTIRSTVLGMKVPSVCVPSKAAVHFRTSNGFGGGGGTTRTFVASERKENAGLGKAAEIGPGVRGNLKNFALEGADLADGVGSGTSVRTGFEAVFS